MKSVRIQLTQPIDLLDAIDFAASAAGVSRSEWIAEACRAKLGREVRQTLAERPKVGRPVEPRV